jgi:hypothetical protein
LPSARRTGSQIARRGTDADVAELQSRGIHIEASGMIAVTDSAGGG